jgi:Undecaprenyl-phosphate galactose phosphotransferase WbaP
VADREVEGRVHAEGVAVEVPGVQGRGAQTGGTVASADSLPSTNGWNRLAHWLALGVSDTASLGISFGIAYLIWAGGTLGQPASLYLRLFPFVLLLPLVYAGTGLYPGFGLGPVETLRRLSLATTISFLMLGGLTFALKLPNLYSRVTFALAWLLSLALIPLARAWLASLAGWRGWWGEPVVVIGNGARLEEAILELRHHPSRGYRPIAALAIEGNECVPEVSGVPVVGGAALAPELARRGVRVAVLVQEHLALGQLGTWLQDCFRQVIVLRGMRELPVEHVEVHNLGNMLGIGYSNQLLLRRNRVIKRALDLIVGTTGSVLALPVIAIAALLVKLSSRGPGFFVQEREGLGGRTIRVRKLRTMHVDADERLATYLEYEPEARRQWEHRFKLTHDPRVVPYVGTFLRRFSLDELPQLLTVVTGEMAFVGPRPFPAYHLQRFSTPFRELRRRVRPGLTGLWQVTVRSEGSVIDQEAYDTYYIRNWSVWLDVYIIARSVSVVLTGRGAY